MTFTLPSRTSSLSTSTTKPPSQNATTLAAMRISSTQLQVAAALPAVKFFPTTPKQIEQAATNEQNAASPPAGALDPSNIRRPGSGSTIGSSPIGRTRGSSSSSTTTPPAAPSEVQSTIEEAVGQAEGAAAGMDDPVVPSDVITTDSGASSGTSSAPRTESSGMGSKLVIGAGIVLGGILVFRLLTK